MCLGELVVLDGVFDQNLQRDGRKEVVLGCGSVEIGAQVHRIRKTNSQKGKIMVCKIQFLPEENQITLLVEENIPIHVRKVFIELLCLRGIAFDKGPSSKPPVEHYPPTHLVIQSFKLGL